MLLVMASCTAVLAARDGVRLNSTKAKGTFGLELSEDGKISNYKLIVKNISNITSVHMHQGEIGTNGPIVMTLYKDTDPVGLLDTVLLGGNVLSDQFEGPMAGKYISDLIKLITEGRIYISICTTQYPEGEIRGQLLNTDDYRTELIGIESYFSSVTSREDIPPAEYQYYLHRLEELASLQLGNNIQAKIYFLIAYCLHCANIDLKRALDNYNLALENGHDEFWVTYNRGALYMELGDIDAARLDLNRAASLHPSHEGAKQLREAVFLPSMLGKNKREMKLASPVVVCCVPKSGTILLRNILKSILGDNLVIPSDSFIRPLASSEYLLALPRLTNRVYVGHIEYSENLAKKLASIPKIVLMRDPRDYVISFTHFMDQLAKGASESQKDWYDKYWSKKAWDEKLSTMIFGLNTPMEAPWKVYPSVFSRYLNYALRWSGPNTLVVRYEDLIGAKFGGNDKTVINTMKSIMDFIGLKIDEAALEQRIVQGTDPIKSKTFRSGGKGNWKQEFKPQHVSQMKIVCPRLLSTLEYELNEEWSLDTNNKTSIPSGTDAGSVSSSIRSLLNNIPGVTMPQYFQLRKESEGKKEVERLIDEWAVDSFIENKQYQYAISILEQLLRQEPYNPVWNYFYALSLHQLRKNLTTALLHYNTALEKGYDEFLIKYNRGLLMIEIGKKDAAIADLERAKTLKPGHQTIQDTLMTMHKKT